MTKARPLTERFWEKVETGPGCWLWQGTIKGGRYGVINRGGNSEGQAYAHRVSWEIAHGPIPAGLDVCHTCDSPPCVNPSHLFVGTRKDNMSDMARKGRHRNGETHKVARITADDVRAMFDRMLQGESYASIAQDFGVSATHVTNIRYGHRWKHLERPAALVWPPAA